MQMQMINPNTSGKGTMSKLVAAVLYIQNTAAAAAISAAAQAARFYMHMAGWEPRSPFHIKAEDLFCFVRS